MTILIFFGVLLVLIIVHEFGHFIVAKRSGIRVDEFGIGFPPKLFSKKYGETEYSINALPFGGFVRIFGENPDEMSISGPYHARALINKPKLIQAAVLFAGVFFNILLAWILFSSTLMMGTPAVGGVEDGRLSQYLSDQQLLVTQVLTGAPAEEASILPGDEIISLHSGTAQIKAETPEIASSFIRDHGGESIGIELRRDGKVETVTVTPKKGLIDSSPDTPAIGVGMGLVGTLKLPVHLALWEGGKQTVEMLYRVAVGIGIFLYDALLFKADLSTVAGPVGIVGLVGNASALGLIALMNFTAVISLNLAVINMIPFPALDGGRLFFLAIEAIKGSPIKPQVANIFNMIGFAFLILLMLIVTYGDISRLVG
ncbi:RIP metalloprotease [candidate division KSB1 bacterium]